MISKSELLHTAQDLFSKYGIKSVRLDDISNKMGISKKTIYSYFKNKEDIVSSIFQTISDQWLIFLNKIERDEKILPIRKLIVIYNYFKEEFLKVNPVFIIQANKYYSSIRQLFNRIGSYKDRVIFIILTDLKNNGLLHDWVRVGYALQIHKTLFELHMSNLSFFRLNSAERSFKHIVLANFLGLLNQKGIIQFENSKPI